VTLAGLQVVLLPKENSANTAAAERQLIVRKVVGLKHHVILDIQTQIWPERLLETTPWLWPSVLQRSSSFTGHEERMEGQRELTTPGNLAQM